VTILNPATNISLEFFHFILNPEQRRVFQLVSFMQENASYVCEFKKWFSRRRCSYGIYLAETLRLSAKNRMQMCRGHTVGMYCYKTTNHLDHDFSSAHGSRTDFCRVCPPMLRPPGLCSRVPTATTSQWFSFDSTDRLLLASFLLEQGCRTYARVPKVARGIQCCPNFFRPTLLCYEEHTHM
jgi:hypothetical protein